MTGSLPPDSQPDAEGVGTTDPTTHVTIPVDVALVIAREVARLQAGRPDLDLDHERAVLHAALDARWTQ